LYRPVARIPRENIGQTGQILAAYKDKFITADFPTDLSSELALYATTVVEGDILMSRTYHNAQPLHLAAKHLHTYLSALE
jgi:hypothetical protein